MSTFFYTLAVLCAGYFVRWSQDVRAESASYQNGYYHGKEDERNDINNEIEETPRDKQEVSLKHFEERE